MNYQHAFHAGNFADVHKHIVLVRILEHLREKPAPFRVVDSHAGAGRYDLYGPEATRSPEWQDGIARLFVAPSRDEAGTLIKPYLDIVAASNPDGTLRVYPGSPLIAKALLRQNDRLIACELEPRAAAALKGVLRGDARVKVLALDGWMAVNANIPPKERRGLVLIDPPYEEAADFTRLSGALAGAHRKWPTGIYLLWYPIKHRDGPDAVARQVRQLGIPKILRCEFMLERPRTEGGLVGSGLMMVNPPYPLERDMRIVLPALGRLLAPKGGHRLDWLAPER